VLASTTQSSIMVRRVPAWELRLVRIVAALVYGASLACVIVPITAEPSSARTFDYAVLAFVVCVHVVGAATCMNATQTEIMRAGTGNGYVPQVDDHAAGCTELRMPTTAVAPPLAGEIRRHLRKSLATQADQLCIVDNPLCVLRTERV
jgi:hypothetical protein